MPEVTIVYGDKTVIATAPVGAVIGEVVAQTRLPLEQPCAGRGTCGKCKVLVEAGLTGPDAVERKNLSPAELQLGVRLACRAKIMAEARVVLTPAVVYSNKIFHTHTAYRRNDHPLGLAIDFGSTTVAAFLTDLASGEVVAGGGALNRQAVFGADVISRLAAALHNPLNAARLQRLALVSISQAIDALNLADKTKARIERATVVCNVAMHHLIAGLPVDQLAVLPFQPYSAAAIYDARPLLAGVFPPHTAVTMPPLIGGFVGSDALACLAYFGFDSTSAPVAAIDLGTNGEVMVTDGQTILTASTAAGPAFEGVNIACGTRAVDGAIVDVEPADGDLRYVTLAGVPPIGLTGSGLLSLVHRLAQMGVIQPSGRLSAEPPRLAERVRRNGEGARCFEIVAGSDLLLTQWDVRELQKAKGAIRATVDVLMEKLNLTPADLRRVILTGSFGGQVNVEAALGLGLIPPVSPAVVETVANGAGLGAAMFLTDAGFDRGEALAKRARQVELEQEPDFNTRFAEAMALNPAGKL